MKTSAQELDKQLTHLQGQAEVATRYHELQGQVSTTQHLLWYVRRNEAAASSAGTARAGHRTPGTELEAETARLRDARAAPGRTAQPALPQRRRIALRRRARYMRPTLKLPVLKQQHCAHPREIAVASSSRSASLNGQADSGTGDCLSSRRPVWHEWREAAARSEARVATCEGRIAGEREKLPLAEEAWQAASARRDEMQQAVGRAEQSRQVRQQTKLSHATRVLDDQLSLRNARLFEEQNAPGKTRYRRIGSFASCRLLTRLPLWKHSVMRWRSGSAACRAWSRRWRAATHCGSRSGCPGSSRRRMEARGSRHCASCRIIWRMAPTWSGLDVVARTRRRTASVARHHDRNRLRGRARGGIARAPECAAGGAAGGGARFRRRCTADAARLLFTPTLAR